jgi:hypothetical protein
MSAFGSKADVTLQRCADMLRLRGRFTDGDVADVARLALAPIARRERICDSARAPMAERNPDVSSAPSSFRNS